MKSIKYKQFRCKVHKKLGKHKGLKTIIIDYKGFLLQNRRMDELETWIKKLDYNRL